MEEYEQVVEQQGTKPSKGDEVRRQMTRYNDAGVITSFAYSTKIFATH